MSFAKAQTKTPELCLQEKKSQAELKKQRREKQRTEKKQMEEHWSKRDCDTMLTTRQTYMQRQEQRLALFFETPEDAEDRSAKRKGLEDHGVLKRKRHSPKPEDLQFDKDGLRQNLCMMLKSISVMSSPNSQPTLRGKKVITFKASLSAALLVKRNSVAVIIALQLSLWLNILHVSETSSSKVKMGDK